MQPEAIPGLVVRQATSSFSRWGTFFVFILAEAAFWSEERPWSEANPALKGRAGQLLPFRLLLGSQNLFHDALDFGFLDAFEIMILALAETAGAVFPRRSRKHCVHGFHADFS